MGERLEVYKKKYPEKWVVMQNSISHVYHQMTLDEKRLIILASPKARMMDATEKDAIKIDVVEYADACDIRTQSAYKQMEKASKTLMKKSFTYRNDKGAKVRAQWVIRSIYNEGSVALCFTDEVLLMLKELDENNPFTKYKKEEVLKLRRDYSIDIYHLAKRWESKGYFAMSLIEISDELGLPKSYELIHNLKRRVIDPSIKEINDKTDIKLSYENVKEGRRVKGILFKIRKRNVTSASTVKNTNNIDEAKQLNPDLFTIDGLSDKQLRRITRHKQFISHYNSMATGSNNSSFTAFSNFAIAEIKKNPSKFNEKWPIKKYLDGSADDYETGF